MPNQHELKPLTPRSARALAFDAFTLRVFRIVTMWVAVMVIVHLFDRG